MGVVVGVGTDLPMRNRGGFFRISGLTCVGIPFWVLLDALMTGWHVSWLLLGRSLEEAPDLAAGRSSACLNMSDTNRVEMLMWPGTSGSPIYSSKEIEGKVDLTSQRAMRLLRF